MQKRLLIIEDEVVIREGVIDFLTDKGYVVDGLESVTDINDITIEKYDLLILDVMLPKLDGFSILKEIRKKSNILILMLTALSSDYDQAKLFELLCDDYLAKPFSLIILEKRIQSLLRRAPTINKWYYKDIIVVFDQFKAYKNNEEINLTTKEIQVLEILVKNASNVLSRKQILDILYDYDAPYDRIVDVYVKNIRKKLQCDCIRTVTGIGYVYEEK